MADKVSRVGGWRFLMELLLHLVISFTSIPATLLMEEHIITVYNMYAIRTVVSYTNIHVILITRLV